MDDLFGEWEGADLDAKVAEATVLARLGALLHDLTHVPFGHSIEDDLGILDAHDENEERFDRLWAQVEPDARLRINERLLSLIKCIVLSARQKTQPNLGLAAMSPEYAFVADIVGNTICADLLDYLPRDHLYVGMPAAFGERYLSEFYVSPSRGQYSNRMVIRIDRNGKPRSDIVSELFKCLRYRYELSERVLFHHAKLAADAMIGRALEAWREHLVSSASGLSPASHAAQKLRIEEEMLKRGDDGLLEHLSELGGGSEHSNAASQLATAILNRRLYKRAALFDEISSAERLHELYSAASVRREVEKDAALYAGVHAWQVLLWVPAPKMRVKLAEVLVRDGSAVSTLREWDKTNGQRGKEIYESHEKLWAVNVFVDSRVSVETQEVIVARLRQKMSVPFVDRRGVAVGTVASIVARRVADQRELPPRKQERLEKAVQQAVEQTATFEALAAHAIIAAEGLATNDTLRPTA